MSAAPLPVHDEWTEDDLNELPDDSSKYEIIDGRLYVTPPPGENHQGVEYTVEALLRGAAPKRWRVRHDIGVRLRPDRRNNAEPDIVVLRPESPRDRIWNEANAVALVVEIQSPSTDSYDRTVKMAAYAAAGIPSYWRVERSGNDLTFVIHERCRDGAYERTVVVVPADVHQVDAPFPVTIDTADLAREAMR